MSLAMGAVIVASGMSACGGGGGEQTKKFEVWSHNSHSKEVITDLVSKWNESEGKKRGIEIVYTVKESQIQQAVDMAFASDQAPDMFTSCNVEKYSDSESIYPINKIAGGEEFIKTYTDKGIDLSGTAFSSSKGDVYCLPFNVNTFGLIYNKDMFKKYGIVDENGEPTPPKTFDEVREYAKKMTDESAGDYGIILPMKWDAFYTTDVLQLVWGSAGVGNYNALSGKYDFSVLKPIYDMYVGIKADSSLYPGAETLDNDAARALFAERNIGMKLAGSYDVGVFNSQFVAKCDWGVAPYPVANDGDRYKQYMGMGGYFALTSKAVEEFGEEDSFAIYKFFHSDDMLKALYQKGMVLPYDYDIVKDVQTDDGLKGWSEFAKLSSISVAPYQNASVEITGEKNQGDVFIHEVWAGKQSVDDAIAELNERYNRGMDTYYANNPSKSKDACIKSEWNTKLTAEEYGKAVN